MDVTKSPHVLIVRPALLTRKHTVTCTVVISHLLTGAIWLTRLLPCVDPPMVLPRWYNSSQRRCTGERRASPPLHVDRLTSTRLMGVASSADSAPILCCSPAHGGLPRQKVVFPARPIPRRRWRPRPTQTSPLPAPSRRQLSPGSPREHRDDARRLPARRSLVAWDFLRKRSAGLGADSDGGALPPPHVGVASNRRPVLVLAPARPPNPSPRCALPSLCGLQRDMEVPAPWSQTRARVARQWTVGGARDKRPCGTGCQSRHALPLALPPRPSEGLPEAQVAD